MGDCPSSPESDHSQPDEDDFEEFVAAALKVDPKGLSGKHRRAADQTDEEGRHLEDQGEPP